MTLSILLTTLIALPITYLAYLIYNAHLGPLSSIPGPLLGKYTDLWRLLSLLRRNPHFDEWELHDKLGPIVRTGPNNVTLSDPRMIPEVFSRQNVLVKLRTVAAYEISFDVVLNSWRLLHPSRPQRKRSARAINLQHARRSSEHQLREASLETVLDGAYDRMEPLFDRSIGALLMDLEERFAAPGKSCVMGDWLQYVAWDVMMEITFGKSMGFMEKAEDVEGLLGITNAVMDYASAHHALARPPPRTQPHPPPRPPGFGPFLSYCTSRLTGRLSGPDGHDPSNPDMLDGFIDARASDPPQMRNGMLMAYVGANVGAGAHTVAAELCCIVYHLAKNPSSRKKLQAELDTVDVKGEGEEGMGTVSWAQCQELVYLEACIQEGLRIFPGIGLPMERRVGSAGLVVPSPSSPSGQILLPPGTMVAMNPYVVNRDKGVFGNDAHLWRPERWLRDAGEMETGFQARSRRMKQSLLTFGAGKRACIGRNIALIECHKVVASLMRKFEVEEAEGGGRSGERIVPLL